MAKKFPINPIKPERICWGCNRFCAADSLDCGNGAERTQHPAELFGSDWMDWGLGSSGSEKRQEDLVVEHTMLIKIHS